ncbi:MAG: hypothetical protein ACR2FS_08560, partial [Phormidesmis sp.]
ERYATAHRTETLLTRAVLFEHSSPHSQAEHQRIFQQVPYGFLKRLTVLDLSLFAYLSLFA